MISKTQETILSSVDPKLRTALESLIPQFEEQFNSIVCGVYNNAVEKCGKSLKNFNRTGANATHTYVRNAEIYLYPFIVNVSENYSEQIYELDANKIAPKANSFAYSVICSWAKKINDKIGKLDDFKVARMSASNSFGFTGYRNGKHVGIDQQSILKCSKNGVWFNQFPARIYVDGEFISEAKYKKLFD